MRRAGAYGRLVAGTAAALLLAGLANVYIGLAVDDEALLAGLAHSGSRNVMIGAGVLFVWLAGFGAGYLRLCVLKHRHYLNLRYHNVEGDDRPVVPGIVLAMFLAGVLVQVLLAYIWVRFLTGAAPDGGEAHFTIGLMFAAAALASIVFWVYELSVVKGDLEVKEGVIPEPPRRPPLPETVIDLAGIFYSVFTVVLVWNGLLLPNAERYVLSELGFRAVFNLFLMGAAYAMLLMPVFRYDYLEKSLLYPERRFSRSPLIVLSALLSTLFALTVLLEF